MSDRYELARNRVEALKGFYVHLAVYVSVNLGLFIIDAIQGGGWWFFWPAIGWGIGLCAHGIALFFGAGQRMTRWEKRKIEEYVERADTEERIGV